MVFLDLDKTAVHRAFGEHDVVGLGGLARVGAYGGRGEGGEGPAEEIAVELLCASEVYCGDLGP